MYTSHRRPLPRPNIHFPGLRLPLHCHLLCFQSRSPLVFQWLFLFQHPVLSNASHEGQPIAACIHTSGLHHIHIALATPGRTISHKISSKTQQISLTNTSKQCLQSQTHEYIQNITSTDDKN